MVVFVWFPVIHQRVCPKEMRLRGASRVKGLACGQHMARAIQEAAENIVGSHGEWFTPSPRCQRGASCAGTCELLEGRMSKTKEGGKGQ